MSTTTATTVTDTLAARAAFTTFIEPGDGVAGALIEALGPVAAFDTITSSGDRHTALVDAGLSAAEAQEALARWTPRINTRMISENLAAVERAGITLVDPDTIPALASLGTQRPVALYVRGNADALAASTPITITGARASTGYGEYAARELVDDLRTHDVTIVSGGAYGIDSSAHRAALGADLPTIAALAGGVDRAYPVGHNELFTRIAVEGAVISEMPVGAAPTKWRFLARNRILAALSRATVVVEAGWRSGSLNIAGHAAALGRPLGAVPGPVTSAASAGCHRLIREYDAKLITGAADVLTLLAGE